jgi:hypothetical protein
LGTLKKTGFALLAATILFVVVELLFWAVGWPTLPSVHASHFEHSRVYWQDEPNQEGVERTHGERIFRMPPVGETPFCDGEAARFESLNQRFPHSFQVSSDANGLRAPAHSVEKDLGVFRILLLGCSTTFGWGVADDESLPAQLEAQLRRSGYAKVEVINGGQPGYSSFQGRRFFEEVAAAYAPDLVMIGYVIQDSRKVAYSDLSQAVLQDRGALIKQGLLYRSRLYQALKLSLGAVVLKSQSCTDDFGRPTEKCVYRVGEARFLENYRALRKSIEAIGAKVGHFSFPEEVAAGHSRQHRFLQGKEAEFEHLPFFDPSLQIEKETRSGKVYYGWDAPNPTIVMAENDAGEPCAKVDEGIRRVDRGHANAEGLARIAQLFSQFLEKEELLP